MGTLSMQVRRGVEDDKALPAGSQQHHHGARPALLFRQIAEGRLSTQPFLEDMTRILLNQQFTKSFPAGVGLGPA